MKEVAEDPKELQEYFDKQKNAKVILAQECAQARRSLRDRDDARGVHGSMHHGFVRLPIRLKDCPCAKGARNSASWMRAAAHSNEGLNRCGGANKSALTG